MSQMLNGPLKTYISVLFFQWLLLVKYKRVVPLDCRAFMLNGLAGLTQLIWALCHSHNSAQTHTYKRKTGPDAKSGKMQEPWIF
jgi:hypothetical protein